MCIFQIGATSPFSDHLELRFVSGKKLCKFFSDSTLTLLALPSFDPRNSVMDKLHAFHGNAHGYKNVCPSN